MSMIAPYGVRRALTNAAALFLALICAATANARPIRILILGDSLTAGYGLAAADGFQAQMRAALQTKGHDVTFVDAAVSGDTSAGGRARLDWALGDPAAGGGADAALVELGANDGLRGLPTADMQANLTAILDTLAKRHIPVLLTGMLAPPNLGRPYGDAFKAVFDALGRHPNVIFDPFFLQGVAADRALNQADGIHPNPQGVKIVVARLLPAMEQLIGKVAP